MLAHTTATTATVHDRIVEVVRRLGGDTNVCRSTIEAIPASEPNRLADALAAIVPARAILTSTLERRLLFTEHHGAVGWTVADLAGQPHRTRAWPPWAATAIGLDDPSSWISTANISMAGIYRLTQPSVLLVALYHPEVFPLPRFPLGISDLARAVRSTLTGQVRLMDMQLGVTLDDIVATVLDDRLDILGVSATFGQHDLLVGLLDAVGELPEPPLVLAGGSLTARNERLLLQRYPWLLIARGAGEPTIADILAYWHGDLDLTQVRGIGYTGAAHGTGTLAIDRYRKTATVANRAQTDIFPELDLLARPPRRGSVGILPGLHQLLFILPTGPQGHLVGYRSWSVAVDHPRDGRGV